MLIQVNTCHPLVGRCSAKIADPSSGLVSLYSSILVSVPLSVSRVRAQCGAQAQACVVLAVWCGLWRGRAQGYRLKLPVRPKNARLRRGARRGREERDSQALTLGVA